MTQRLERRALRTVAEIAASAQQQAAGLAEVNTAVNQMDQVTQQNAAMVEESTAASHSLAQEAETLAQAIARFAPATDAAAIAFLWRESLARGDDIPGGFVQENFGDKPEVFYSKKDMANRAKELGLQPFVRHVEGSKHTSRWV